MVSGIFVGKQIFTSVVRKIIGYFSSQNRFCPLLLDNFIKNRKIVHYFSIGGTGWMNMVKYTGLQDWRAGDLANRLDEIELHLTRVFSQVTG